MTYKNRKFVCLYLRYIRYIDKATHVMQKCHFLVSLPSANIRSRWRLLYVRNREQTAACNLCIDRLSKGSLAISVDFSLASLSFRIICCVMISVRVKENSWKRVCIFHMAFDMPLGLSDHPCSELVLALGVGSWLYQVYKLILDINVHIEHVQKNLRVSPNHYIFFYRTLQNMNFDCFKGLFENRISFTILP